MEPANTFTDSFNPFPQISDNNNSAAVITSEKIVNTSYRAIAMPFFTLKNVPMAPRKITNLKQAIVKRIESPQLDQFKENATWKQIIAEKISLQWGKENIVVSASASSCADISNLNGVILWKESGASKYTVLAGEDRISSWLQSDKTEVLAGIFYVGKPKTQKIHRFDCTFNVSMPMGISGAITREIDVFHVKKSWLFSEWDSPSPRGTIIQNSFINHSDLHPFGNANKELVSTVFDNVRGKFSLWGDVKEDGRWIKIVTESLSRKWVEENVTILFKTKAVFELLEMNHFILWQEPGFGRYQLLDGNRRMSSWLFSQQNYDLPATFFVGGPRISF